MAKNEGKWSLEKAYPPMLWVDFRPLRKKVVAEWLHCAGLACNEYDLERIAEMIAAIVLAELTRTAESPWNAVRDLTEKEED